MKNFSIKLNDKEYWISRSVATCTYIFKNKNDKLYVLVERRGKGAADNIGKLCCPCGYLDYDETLKESAAREVKEETGFLIKKDKLTLMNIDSSPKSNHQNITINYIYMADEDEDFDTKNAQGGEEDEISEVKWFYIGDVKPNNSDSELQISSGALYNITAEEWAFNHDNNIIKYLSKIFIIKYKNEEEKKQ